MNLKHYKKITGVALIMAALIGTLPLWQKAVAKTPEVEPALPSLGDTFNITIYTENDQPYFGEPYWAPIEDQIKYDYGLEQGDSGWEYWWDNWLNIYNVTNTSNGDLLHYGIYSYAHLYYGPNSTGRPWTRCNDIHLTNKEIQWWGEHLPENATETISTYWGGSACCPTEVVGGYELVDYNDYWYRVKSTTRVFAEHSADQYLDNISFDYFTEKILCLSENLLISKTNRSGAVMTESGLEYIENNQSPLYINAALLDKDFWEFQEGQFCGIWFNDYKYMSYKWTEEYVDFISYDYWEEEVYVINQTYNVTIRCHPDGRLWGIFINRWFNDTSGECEVNRERIQIWFGDPYIDLGDDTNFGAIIGGSIGGGVAVVLVVVLIKKRKKKKIETPGLEEPTYY
ncbi:MAG: hypothetical protein GF364_01620 [Candidatus Lokiarchaeota archaeon]|nr:hypothetical protein [Candidatus Lokiarchaeota archaeon]